MKKPKPSKAPAVMPLSPSIQRYAWGDSSFIAELCGLGADGGPVAEAWFGAHPIAPALANVDGDLRPLDAVLAEHGEDLLGAEVSVRFGGLPYLLKILAAEKPLSIQVHPSLAQAKAGFAREEQAGLPRDAPNRCYRDASHKPELLVALSGFDALCGFRTPEEIAAALAELPELRQLLPAFEPSAAGLSQMLAAYFALPDGSVETAWQQIILRLENSEDQLSAEAPAFWALRAHRTLSGAAPDRGLLFVFLLGLVHLEPGQGLFLPAGVPHAYLRGAGVELMASSDNVLRAGLTPKHIDTAELLRIVRFDAGVPPIVEAVTDDEEVEGIYPIPAAELGLTRIQLRAGVGVERTAHGAETLLATAGAIVTVRYDGSQLELAAGRACLVPHGVRYRIEATGAATVFRAGVPGGQHAESFRGRTPARLAFGTSGLRGLVSDITDLEAYINTRGFLDYLVAIGDAAPGTPVVLAGDQRPSSERILGAVARAIQDCGLGVQYVGRIPTPALTYFGLAHAWPSIMVTGSHIPFDRNGIKFNKSTGEVLKSDEAAILAAVERVRYLEYRRSAKSSAFDDDGRFRAGPQLPAASDAARRRYVRRYLDAFPADALGGLTVALYEHSAVGREVLAEILTGLGATVYPVGRSETFVAIDTEAISDAQLATVQRLADEVRAKVGRIDAVVSTDGDSDRPMLLGVDGDGRAQFFPGDVLGTVVADYLGADAIAVPISSNDVIERYFAPRGVTVVRTRIGSPWVIAAMAELPGERVVGWEANGGFLTGSSITLEAGQLAPLPTRDAVLPLVAALSSARRAGRSLPEILEALPARFGKSGLLDDVAPDKSRALVERFGPGDESVRRALFADEGVRVVDVHGSEHAAGSALAARLSRVRDELRRQFDPARGFGGVTDIDYLDGIRIRFENGDIAHVRPSGNAPQLRIYAIADSESRAAEIVALALAEPDGILRALLR